MIEFIENQQKNIHGETDARGSKVFVYSDFNKKKTFIGSRAFEWHRQSPWEKMHILKLTMFTELLLCSVIMMITMMMMFNGIQ